MRVWQPVARPRRGHPGAVRGARRGRRAPALRRRPRPGSAEWHVPWPSGRKPAADLEATDVRRGDVIVFTQKVDGERYVFIWRVIALPGDVVDVSGDSVVINGAPLSSVAPRDEGNISVFQETNTRHTRSPIPKLQRKSLRFSDGSVGLALRTWRQPQRCAG